jgi:hypothetical protein
MSQHDFANYLLEGYLYEAKPTSASQTSGTPNKKAPQKKEVNAKTLGNLSSSYRKLSKSTQKDVIDRVKEVYQNDGKFERIYKANNGDMVRVIQHLLVDANKSKNQYNSVQEMVDTFVQVYSSLRHVDLSKLEPIDYEPNASESQMKPDIVKWEPYAKFREEMYGVTVQMGWPANLKPDPANIKSDETVDEKGNKKSNSELWKGIGKTPRVFEGWTPAYFDKTTTTIKTYLMTKFKGNPAKLQQLRGKVEAILEQEKTYLSTSSPLKKGFNILANLGKFIYMGLGGQERELAFLKFIKSKMKTMSIFEYQAIVLNDVILRMSITDNTAESLKKSLTSVYNATKNFVFSEAKIGNVDPIRTEYNYGLVAYFLVKSSKQTTATGVVEDLFFALMNGGDEKANNPKDPSYEPKGIIAKMAKNSVDSQNFSSGPSIKQIADICKQAVLKTSGHTDRTAFRNSIKDGLTFELLNKDSKGHVIGTYTWKIFMVTRAVRFELKYESETNYNGGED